ATESLDLASAGSLAGLPFDIPTTLGKRAHGFPLAPPPPSDAGIPVPADELPAEPGPPVRPSSDLPPALPPPPGATGHSYTLGLPGRPDDIVARPPSPPPRPVRTPPAGLPSTDLGALAARIAGAPAPSFAPPAATAPSSATQLPPIPPPPAIRAPGTV